MNAATPAPVTSNGSGSFDLWGASEWINLAALVLALAALIVTIIGVVLALRALYLTRQYADEAARDARRILENELAAQLEFAPDKWGPVVLFSNHQVPEGMTGFASNIRNVGRYPSRDIAYRMWYGDQEIESYDFPTMLPANAEPRQFSFTLPIDRKATGPYLPMRFHVTYRDGNPTSAPLDACYLISRDHPKVIWNSRPCGQNAVYSARAQGQCSAGSAA